MLTVLANNVSLTNMLANKPDPYLPMLANKTSCLSANVGQQDFLLICQCWPTRLPAYMPMLASKTSCLYASGGK
ncbi:hypothetical protein RRG08_037754 [Elysia crispata]|uniref:Uncharacterized protein n=1 Tax=Elysia crispata TaxID=231223 RepID=A0AAE1A848_9GAST|nr:hypothetical protein RRG08_037754 [Elysia crispata]